MNAMNWSGMRNLIAGHNPTVTNNNLYYNELIQLNNAKQAYNRKNK